MALDPDMNPEFEARLARARKIQLVILSCMLGLGGSVALVVGLATQSLAWSAIALIGIGAVFSGIGFLLLVFFGGRKWLGRVLKRRSRSQGG